jgi:hypothetical protein
MWRSGRGVSGSGLVWRERRRGRDGTGRTRREEGKPGGQVSSMSGSLLVGTGTEVGEEMDRPEERSVHCSMCAGLLVWEREREVMG